MIQAFFFIRLMIGSHTFKRDTLLPIGKPRYVKGRDPLLHNKDDDARDSQASETFIPIKELL